VGGIVVGMIGMFEVLIVRELVLCFILIVLVIDFDVGVE